MSYQSVRRIVQGLDRGLLAMAHHDRDVYRDECELVLRRESAHPSDVCQADHAELDRNSARTAGPASNESPSAGRPVAGRTGQCDRREHTGEPAMFALIETISGANSETPHSLAGSGQAISRCHGATVARLTRRPMGTDLTCSAEFLRAQWEAQMMADERPSQAGAAGDRDQAEGAEEPALDVKGGPDDGPDATQDPAEGAADIPG